jgi:hypothetical protein
MTEPLTPLFSRWMKTSTKDGTISSGKPQLKNQSIDSTDSMLRLQELAPSMRLLSPE